MKSILNMIALASVFFIFQACGNKNDTPKEVQTEVAKPAEKTQAELVAERRAQIKLEAAQLAEKRRLEWEKVVLSSVTYIDTKGNKVFYKAEVNPSFIGGDEAMMKYLQDNLIYPEQAKRDNLEGTVFVDFVVGANGIVRDIEVTDATSTAIDPSFKEEAIRVVASMPKWLPGLQNQKPVEVKYSIPISFQLI